MQMLIFWNRLLGKEVESLSLEVFKECGDAALRDVVSGRGGDGSVVLSSWRTYPLCSRQFCHETGEI